MKQSLESAYLDYGKLLVGIMVHQTGNIQDAEEIVHDVFISFDQSWAELPTELDTKAWLIRVAFNKSIDKFRRAKRFVNLLLNNDYPTEQNSIESFNLSKDLWLLLSSLKELERMVIILKYYEEYDYHEISKMLNMSEGSLKSIASRAMEKMRKI